jgi:hypothetical protein
VGGSECGDLVGREMIDVLAQVAQWAGTPRRRADPGTYSTWSGLEGLKETEGLPVGAGAVRDLRADLRGAFGMVIDVAVDVDAVVGSLRIEEQEVVRAWW